MRNRRALHRPALVSLLVSVALLLASAPAHSAEGVLSGKTICLDPGHGGSDPGAVYDDGTIYLEEADINLDVAYGLKALLEGDGAAVPMTRTGDEYRSNSDRYTFCNEAQATILVSIHTNSVSDPSVDGSLALYFHSDDKALAGAIYDVMYPALRDTAPHSDSFRDFGLDRFASGVLLKSDMPAAMMEPLFMSHPAEAEELVTPIYTGDGTTTNSACSDCRRAQIASAIYEGILSYFGSDGGVDDGIILTATGYKVRGLQKADLAWSGATSTNVVVYRDGSLIATTENSDSYTDDIDQRGGGSYTYQVCEAGTDTCSNEATVTF